MRCKPRLSGLELSKMRFDDGYVKGGSGIAGDRSLYRVAGHAGLNVSKLFQT